MDRERKAAAAKDAEAVEAPAEAEPPAGGGLLANAKISQEALKKLKGGE